MALQPAIAAQLRAKAAAAYQAETLTGRLVHAGIAVLAEKAETGEWPDTTDLDQTLVEWNAAKGVGLDFTHGEYHHVEMVKAMMECCFESIAGDVPELKELIAEPMTARGGPATSVRNELAAYIHDNLLAIVDAAV